MLHVLNNLHPSIATSEGTSEECFVSQVGLGYLLIYDRHTFCSSPSGGDGDAWATWG